MGAEVPEHDAENDQDRSADDIDVDEANPEDDLEVELESDLQPAHRAEALDVLATIELKFALLRERVYVEKMQGLAWEETLVSEGVVIHGYLSAHAHGIYSFLQARIRR